MVQANPTRPYLLLSVVAATFVLGACRPLENEDTRENDDSDVVFEAEHLQRFEVTMAPADLVWLRSHAVDEIYVPAQLVADGGDVGEVGIRFKGSYSLDECFDSEEQTCAKVSMKIKFNEFDPDKRWHGLRRLAFDAPFWDQSLLRERLANEMYRDMGIVAPRVNHGQLTINGEDQGVFALVEQADGSFTDNRWPGNGDGNLYKEAWPGVDGQERFASQLRTNEETANHDVAVRFSTELMNAADTDRTAVVEKYMDVDQLLTILALDEATRNWDGITTFYVWATGGVGHNHNFYLYQEEHADRFWLIAWDLDQTFELTERLPGYPRWSDPPGDCTQRYALHSGTQTGTAPNCDPLLRGLAQVDRQRYLEKVQGVLDGPFQIDTANIKLDRWAAQIADAVAIDPNGPGTESWEIGLASLRETLAMLRERLENHRNGVESAPFGLASTRPADFEATDAVGLASGVLALTNPKSATRLLLNREDPLDGAQDLRVDFDLRNEFDDAERGGWSQWIVVRLGFENQPTSLLADGVTAVRFVARSDKNRTMRVDFESRECERLYEGICFGWDVPLSAETQPYELLLGEATLPSWATPGSEDLDAVLRSVLAVNLRPDAVGRNAAGVFPEGESDAGWVQIDDIEFVSEAL